MRVWTEDHIHNGETPPTWLRQYIRPTTTVYELDMRNYDHGKKRALFADHRGVWILTHSTAGSTASEKILDRPSDLEAMMAAFEVCLPHLVRG